jgi:HpcH/HpaI aldolase/citrate lyase family
MATLPDRFGKDFCLTLLTDDAEFAAVADRAGVNRVGVDLEYLGKSERQAGMNTRLERHDWDDLSRLASVVRSADLFVRVNPIHAGTEVEIETALEIGARVLMLPAFRTADEVEIFARTIRERARVLILLEMAPAVVRIREILEVPGIDEVMLGLNDLRLQMGVSNHFEVLASPLTGMLADEVHRRGLPLSIGGVARVGDQRMPVPTDLVHAQYPRLGATGAWVARSFTNSVPAGWDFTGAILALRDRLSEWAASSPEDLENARAELARYAAEWRQTSRRPRSAIA